MTGKRARADTQAKAQRKAPKKAQRKKRPAAAVVEPEPSSEEEHLTAEEDLYTEEEEEVEKEVEVFNSESELRKIVKHLNRKVDKLAEQALMHVSQELDAAYEDKVQVRRARTRFSPRALVFPVPHPTDTHKKGKHLVPARFPSTLSTPDFSPRK